MDKSGLGSFLRNRRERVNPRDVGLPEASSRRTPGLRREEVAVLAHISTEYYTRLEQARAPRPSAEVLAGLAAALGLGDAEAEHLHRLAGTAPMTTGMLRRDVRPSIQTMIDRLPQTAGLVLSASFDILAWNPLAAVLLADFAHLPARERNLAVRAFLRPVDAMFGIEGQDAFRRGAVSQLRITAARYPDDASVAGLIADLRTGSADFDELWVRQDVDPTPTLRKTFHHPAVGRITLDCDALHLPDRDQTVVLYSAPLGSRDAESLALLGTLAADGVDVRAS
jgi:transcriptional regulator with XRE-family HTH domain